MEYTAENLGWKLYGLYEFSKVGLFNRPFTIFLEDISKEQIIERLKSLGFVDNSDLAIRFSKENAMTLPFFIGKFTLDKVANIIKEERKDYVPFVHGLIKTEYSMCIYYDGKIIYIDVWPGIGGSKKNIFNVNSDLIKINDKITISRFLNRRKVETVSGDVIFAEPFKLDLLIDIAKKIKSFEDKFVELLKINNPLLCDVNCESLDDINFMGIQKTSKINIDKIDSLAKDFCVVKTLNELEEYQGGKDLFFDIPLDIHDLDWEKILSILKHFNTVYLKSLTMHLAVILREHGVNVKKGFINSEYEIKEFDF